MQSDKNDMKVKKSVSMHSHAFERPCKRHIVTDSKSRNASHINSLIFLSKNNNSMNRKVESIEKSYKFKLQNVNMRNKVFQKKKITVKDTARGLSLKAFC